MNIFYLYIYILYVWLLYKCFYGKFIGSNSSGKCVKEDMMDLGDLEDYVVYYDYFYVYGKIMYV